MVVLKQVVYLIVVKVSNVSAALYLISRLRFCKNLALNRGSFKTVVCISGWR